MCKVYIHLVSHKRKRFVPVLSKSHLYQSQKEVVCPSLVQLTPISVTEGSGLCHSCPTHTYISHKRKTFVPVLSNSQLYQSQKEVVCASLVQLTLISVTEGSGLSQCCPTHACISHRKKWFVPVLSNSHLYQSQKEDVCASLVQLTTVSVTKGSGLCQSCPTHTCISHRKKWFVPVLSNSHLYQSQKEEVCPSVVQLTPVSVTKGSGLCQSCPTHTCISHRRKWFVPDLSRAQRTLSNSLVKFNFECIGTNLTDDEVSISVSLKEFGRLIANIEDQRDMMLDRAYDQIILPLENFRKEHIGGVKEGKKKFEKQTAKFCLSQERYLGLSTKKQDTVLKEVSHCLIPTRGSHTPWSWARIRSAW
uniref:BAR domain-containing protein n=1 Tax=Timema cristinae TaxID=61476 RepID=A0A7R9GQV0_TIMCR|nr:unnamed protein product [Timema cristinae]